MPKKDVHVVPHARGWATKTENAGRAGVVVPTQREAIARARTTAERRHAGVVIHGRDGAIRNSNSYGNDPNPPKDKVR